MIVFVVLIYCLVMLFVGVSKWQKKFDRKYGKRGRNECSNTERQ